MRALGLSFCKDQVAKVASEGVANEGCRVNRDSHILCFRFSVANTLDEGGIKVCLSRGTDCDHVPEGEEPAPPVSEGLSDGLQWGWLSVVSYFVLVLALQARGGERSLGWRAFC